MELKGTIVAIDKKICIVYTEGKKYRVLYTRRIEGAYENQAKPVTVGDEVFFERGPSRLGWITQVLPRKTWLARNAIEEKREQVVVANVEQACIISSIFAPPFRPGIIDRLLVGAHRGDLTPVIVVNKIDLQSMDKRWAKVNTILEVYKNIGYTVIYTSAISGAGLDELKQMLCNKSTVFVGHSGTGKSSLLSAIDPNIKLKTQEVGRKSRRGVHTTSRVTLLPFAMGGFLVDTPGLREFALWDANPQEIKACFPEMSQYANSCKYKSCIHIPEPDCGVKKAVEEQKIAPFRYESYCRILQSMGDEEE